VPNVFFPAPKPAIPPQYVLAIFISGVGLGGLAVGFLDRVGQASQSSAAPSGWKRARDWAKTPGLSKERRLALEWIDKNADDPTIQVLEFSKVYRDADKDSIVYIKSRVKDGDSTKVEVFNVYVMADGRVKARANPYLEEGFKEVEPAIVMSDR